MASEFDTPTQPQMVALRAVREGRVCVGRVSRCRSYPPYVHPSALDAAWRRRWWRWDLGQWIAVLTDAGERAWWRGSEP